MTILTFASVSYLNSLFKIHFKHVSQSTECNNNTNCSLSYLFHNSVTSSIFNTNHFQRTAAFFKLAISIFGTVLELEVLYMMYKHLRNFFYSVLSGYKGHDPSIELFIFHKGN